MAKPAEMHDHHHYVERDSGTGAGLWAVVAVLIVLLAVLLFGSNLFGGSSSDSENPGANVDIDGASGQ